MNDKEIYSKSSYVSEVKKIKDNYIAEIGGQDYWSKKDIFNLKGCDIDFTYMISQVGSKTYYWIKDVLNFKEGQAQSKDNVNNTTKINVPGEDKYSDNKTLNTCLMVAGEITKIAYGETRTGQKLTTQPLEYCINAFKALLRATKDV